MTGARPVTVLIVRHAEQERRGDDDGLTDRGRQQVGHLATAVSLTPDDVLVSSGLRRAITTARGIGREPVQFQDLDEFRFGPQWTWQQSQAREDRALWLPEHSAGAETLGEFEARVCRTFEALVREQPTGPGRLVCVVHSGVIDVLMRWAFGATGGPWVAEVCVAHASITELGVELTPPGRDDAVRLTEVRRVGDVLHVPRTLRTGT